MEHTYSICEGGFRNSDSVIGLQRGNARFRITVLHEEVRTTAFGKQYLRLLDDERDEISGVLSIQKPLQFLRTRCLPALDGLAEDLSFDNLTLADFVASPLFQLAIVPATTPDEVDICSKGPPSFSPALWMQPLALEHMNKYKEIELFDAGMISMRDSVLHSSGQGLVILPDGRRCFMKLREAAREKHFDRELEMLWKIDRLHLSDHSVKVPRLVGIVVSRRESGSSCVGVLIEHIPVSISGGSLLTERLWPLHDTHTVWEQQVSTIVATLHSHDLIWGDVNPGNVVIDDSLNAWVIDFGGMNNPEFVDDDKCETVEGDLQGVKRLFREWLPRMSDSSRALQPCTEAGAGRDTSPSGP